MEEGNNKGDFHGNVVKQSSLRPISTLKPTLSGRSTPRSSPTFRRLPSTRTPRREGRSGAGFFQLFRSSRLVYWLLLITLWTYGGFYIQSKWAHGDNRENFDGFGSKPSKEVVYSDQNQRRGLISNDSLREVKNKSSNSLVRNGKQLADNIDVALAKKGSETLPRKVSSMKRSKSSGRGSRSKTLRKPKKTVESTKGDEVIQEEEIPATNASYGLLVGPFGSTEDRVLEWSPEKRSGTCDRKELFARLVWSRNFVLIFHELSMTGAPLSMLELATELLSCGATVHAVVLSRRGGLMSELVRRRIKVIDDKADHSYKAAMKADLVIAGSAVCAQWIEKYLGHYVAGSNQIAWWIMENRREYFDRSKLVLNQVKMLIFLSESQSIQWLAWCEEENIKLSTQTALIPLSVNDELAFIAGIPCSLNTPSLSPEKMLEKQQMLRNVVRQEMGLADNDMLVMSLGSINAAKGQLLLLESARSIIEKQPSEKELTPSSSRHSQNASTLAKRFRFRGLLQNLSHSSDSAIKLNASSILNASSNNAGHGLKILIGSVGSKSNKVAYVKEILRFLSEHPELHKSVIWTPSTARVASLYSAADAYVTNSQGVGETFGRVTIEAMAFGLPVLGTDAGGTKEIVEHNATGLLHLIGRPGSKVLSQNLWFMLENPSARKEMGRKGREKVEKMYMKKHMYKSFFEVLFQCMRIK